MLDLTGNHQYFPIRILFQREEQYSTQATIKSINQSTKRRKIVIKIIYLI